MSFIKNIGWVERHLDRPNLVIVDCRFVLGQPISGKTAYAEGHLPGAVYFDLEEDLSGTKQTHGGRHPMPDWDTFVRKLGRAGIDQDTVVLTYDDQGGAMASRFWWMLRYLGHEKVSVMEEGFTAWQTKGLPVTTETPEPKPVVFVPKVRPEMLVSVEDVRGSLGRPGTVIIDSREEKRYLGLEEPVDAVAGHIPGARNRFWKDSLRADGGWKTADDQQQRFADVKDAKEIIVYCGSGVTACPNVLALSEAGITGVKLYGGSWSDWISYADNPIATGEE